MPTPDPPLPPGTRVVKINSVADDAHQDGAAATVIAYWGPTKKSIQGTPAGTYAYFVVWDDMPEVPVGIVGTRIKRT